MVVMPPGSFLPNTERQIFFGNPRDGLSKNSVLNFSEIVNEFYGSIINTVHSLCQGTRPGPLAYIPQGANMTRSGMVEYK